MKLLRQRTLTKDVSNSRTQPAFDQIIQLNKFERILSDVCSTESKKINMISPERRFLYMNHFYSHSHSEGVSHSVDMEFIVNGKYKAEYKKSFSGFILHCKGAYVMLEAVMNIHIVN